MKRIISAIFLSIALSACAQLGMQPAQSFDEKLAYAQGSVTSLRISTATALTAGAIDVNDAKEVQDLADNARKLLDSARGLELTDITSANGKYALAIGILSQLQSYALKRGIK